MATRDHAMTSRRSAAKLAAAYHEAGHAVAVFELGYRVRRVSIVPNGYNDGRVEWDNPVRRRRVREALECGNTNDVDKVKYLIEHVIITAFAGPVAHKRHNPRARGGWTMARPAQGQGSFSARVLIIKSSSI